MSNALSGSLTATDIAPVALAPDGSAALIAMLTLPVADAVREYQSVVVCVFKAVIRIEKHGGPDSVKA